MKKPAKTDTDRVLDELHFEMQSWGGTGIAMIVITWLTIDTYGMEVALRSFAVALSALFVAAGYGVIATHRLLDRVNDR